MDAFVSMPQEFVNALRKTRLDFDEVTRQRPAKCVLDPFRQIISAADGDPDASEQAVKLSTICASRSGQFFYVFGKYRGRL